MEDSKKEDTQEEEECRPLTDEEFKAFQEEEKRTEKKLNWFMTAVQAVIDFFT